MKSKYQAALQEAFLKSAFEEAAEQEIAELEAMDIEIPEPTEKQRRELERALRLAEKKGSGASKFKRIVAVIAVFFSLSFVLLMFQPTVRASVLDTVVSFFEKYVLFAFNDELQVSYSIGDYTITYIPKGYELTDEKDIPIKSERVFSDGENSIGICLYYTGFNSFSADEGISPVDYLEIGEFKGYLAINNDANTGKLVWGNTSITFTISGIINEEEFIKIAKNIK